MTLIVGLTGGIGSGKSSVGRHFERYGIAIVDADALSRALTAPGGAAMPAIAAAFGAEFVAADGALDRTRMRDLVFSDPTAKRRLEAILHPAVREASDRAVAAATSPYVILMIPLLVESGAPRARCHRLLVVDLPEAMQVERVIARDRLPREQVLAIMASQATRAQRLAVADDVIDNSGTEAALAPQVAALHERYSALAREPQRPLGGPSDR